MCMLIKDLRRSGVHVCANKGLSGKTGSQALRLRPGVFGREAGGRGLALALGCSSRSPNVSLSFLFLSALSHIISASLRTLR